MKITLLTIFLFFTSIHISAKSQIDSLLLILDKTISQRHIYTQEKEEKIRTLKLRSNKNNTPEEQYQINRGIINEYQSYLCDSAISYINKNIALAGEMNHANHLSESKLQLSFVLSLSGLFTQALEILNTIDYESLPSHLKAMYCWNYIRYYENLINYTDDAKFSHKYAIQKEQHRDNLMHILSENSGEYEKEKAFILQERGQYVEALEILQRMYLKQEPSTHGYAMEAMGLARIYHAIGDKKMEEKFLIIAATTDIRLAVKENEALLSLAILVNKRGDNSRAYNYIKAALEDANFYNSRFRNTVIARVQPIIEETYLLRIEKQSRNLRLYAFLTSILVIILIITIYFIYKQIRTVSRARKNLRIMNEELAGLNQKLDEANLIKEEYIGYFMNQCAVYIDKLDEYRKNVNRKIRAGQIDDLHKITSSTRNLEKEVEELCNTFDEVFLKLYPNFVVDFNALLREEEQYKLKKGQLNTELRIFALMRLGITDTNQISIFLRYSVQTIYNYKSKVKRKALIDGELLEEEVKKIGSIS